MASGVTPRLPPCPPPAPHTASHAPVDDHAAAAKREGDAAFGRGDFAAAASAYASALNHLAPLGHDPHLRGTLLANRCLTLLRLGGQTAAALADAREACRMRPRWAKAHVRLAQVRRVALPGCGSSSLELLGDRISMLSGVVCEAQAHEDGGDFAAAAVSYKRAVELEAALEPTLVKAVAALERRAARQHCLVTMQGHQGAIYDAAVHPQVCPRCSAARQVCPLRADRALPLACSPSSWGRWPRSWWRRAAPTRLCVFGAAGQAASCSCWLGTATGSHACAGARAAVCWPAPRWTARPASGGWHPGAAARRTACWRQGPCWPWATARGGSPAWTSAPAAACSPRAPAVGRCGCGAWQQMHSTRS